MGSALHDTQSDERAMWAKTWSQHVQEPESAGSEESRRARLLRRREERAERRRQRRARAQQRREAAAARRATAAGPVGDWNEYGIDQVLRLLYDFARNPINDGTLVFSLASICAATRLDTEPAIKTASALVEKGLAEQPSPMKFRITPRGMQAVHLASQGMSTGLR